MRHMLIVIHLRF